MDSYLGGLASRSDASSSMGAEGATLFSFKVLFFKYLVSVAAWPFEVSCKSGYLPCEESCFLLTAPRLPGCLTLSSASLMDRLASIFIFFSRSAVIMKVSSSDSNQSLSFSTGPEKIFSFLGAQISTSYLPGKPVTLL